MTRAISVCALGLAALYCWTSSALGDDIVRGPPRYIRISVRQAQGTWAIGLIDGQIGLLGLWKEDKDDSNLPVMAKEDGTPRTAMVFEQDGDTLRLHVDQFQKDASKTQAEKDRWFLSVEYGDHGGKVVLTKAENKSSHWDISSRQLIATDPDVERCFIKNKNDSGKDAWLSMEPNGVRYKGHVEVRQPIISFSEKLPCAIRYPYEESK